MKTSRAKNSVSAYDAPTTFLIEKSLIHHFSAYDRDWFI